MVGCYLVSENPDEKFDIKFELHTEHAKVGIPEEQQKLYIEAESTNNIIKSLANTKKEIKEKYFKKLLSLSQAGLVSDVANPQLALASLDKLKEEILTIEGQRIKNDYMKKLGLSALCINSIVLTVYFIINYFNTDIFIYSMYFVVFVSSLIGTWISFGARKFNIYFNQLNNLEEDMMIPCIRLVYIGVCSVIFLLFLNSGIITISIGNFSLNNISTNFELQSTIGILCGLVESKLGINLYNKAKTIVGE